MVMERLDQLEECQQIKRRQKQSTFQTLQKVYEEEMDSAHLLDIFWNF